MDLMDRYKDRYIFPNDKLRYYVLDVIRALTVDDFISDDAQTGYFHLGCNVIDFVHHDEIFHFGDENAYMSFTPENSQGKAEFTITNGDNIQKLTAQKSLAKGEWSKVTIRIIGGQGELLINGQLDDSKPISITALNVLSASENDRCILGGFKGAVDYCNLYFKAVDEPSITYSGSEPIDERLMGDVNADGQFNVADLVGLQSWLIGREKTLADWEAGNFIDDGRLDVFDLVIMRRALIS